MLKPLLLSYWLVLATTLLLSACSSSPSKPTLPIVKPPANLNSQIKLGPPLTSSGDATVLLYPTEFNQLTGWQQDNHAQAYSAFQRSCASWRKQADSKPLGGIFQLGAVGDWKKLCNLPVRVGNEKQFFENQFKPYAIATDNQFEGLFTGYFLPELHGSFQKSSRFRFPVYAIPPDLIKQGEQVGRMANGQFVPYYQRAEISAGALNGKGAELLWVDDEIDAYFMEVQGSGRVILPDGRVQGVGFAGKNGQPYFAIGKWLVEQGYIPLEQISMQSIRAWLIANPAQAKTLLHKNPSVVFFRLTTAAADEGPVGTLNTPLTAGYSLAVDNRYLPLGIPLWLTTTSPDEKQCLQRLVMAQDTGGAIKGVIRGDVYWGQGPQAGEIAGVMQARGRLFLLIPKNIRLGG